MKASRPYCRSVLSTLLAGSVLASQTAAVYAQTAPVLQPPVPGSPAAADASTPPAARAIRAITVVGNQRLEADTVRSYAQLRVGQIYSRATLDAALTLLSEFV